MLLSDSHKFIFIHNYKVAGTSIRKALRPYETPANQRLGWPKRQLARLGLVSAPTCADHAKATEVRDAFPERWQRYFTFGFVRNPWAWQVSLYFYMLQNEDHWFYDEVTSMDGFEEYIEWRVRNGRALQSSFFCKDNGEIIVDFIGRLENIRTDFQRIAEQIGVEASLPQKNESSHGDYRDYYDDHARSLVATHFAEDIDRFGYTFNGSPAPSPVLTP